MCISCFGLSKQSRLVGKLVEENGDSFSVNLYSYRELRKATGNFNLANKIGEGGFGSVYKAKLKNGLLAAVKVLSAESRQGMKEFLTELNVISKIKHDNLVDIYGCCVDGNNRILVYNYLENNSLAQTLLSRKSQLHFDWTTRVYICIGIAEGLAYLHDIVKPHIVHRDIKASNILLDGDLKPKISDFGLAKLLPPDATHVSTRIAGTLGYLAPEYALRGQVTKKSDIYSFGVLILEIVSGRCNKISTFPPEERFLLERTWTLYEKDELEAIVDSNLNGEYDPAEAKRILQVGLLCAQDAPKLRPSMASVVKFLTGEKAIDRPITRPGLIMDFVPPKSTDQNYSSSGPYNSSSTTTTNAAPLPTHLPTER